MKKYSPTDQRSIQMHKQRKEILRTYIVGRRRKSRSRNSCKGKNGRMRRKRLDVWLKRFVCLKALKRLSLKDPFECQENNNTTQISIHNIHAPSMKKS